MAMTGVVGGGAQLGGTAGATSGYDGGAPERAVRVMDVQVERQSIHCTEKEKAAALSQLNQMEAERQKALERRAEAEAAASSAEDRAERSGMTRAEEEAIAQAAAADMERSLREVTPLGARWGVL